MLTDSISNDPQLQSQHCVIIPERQSVDPKPSVDYLQELIRDKRMAALFQFHHVERLIDNEITRVRVELFHMSKDYKVDEETSLPAADGATVTLQEKVFIPVKENPTYNFVGRLLGPGGMTTKHMEKCLGCKIMIRGRGSMRDKKKEEANRGKPNWEHLSEDLHVLISVEDTENRAPILLTRAVHGVKNFLDDAVKTPDGEDEVKKKQLIELALLNGTYRDMSRRDEVGNNPDVAKGNNWLTNQALLGQPLGFYRGLPNQQSAGSALLLPSAPSFQQARLTAPGQLLAANPGDPLAMFGYQQAFPGSEYLFPSTSPIGSGLLEYSQQAAGAPGVSLDSSVSGPLKGASIQGVRLHPYSRKGLV